jgi:GNAT superfamily N-acetyltransferase
MSSPALQQNLSPFVRGGSEIHVERATAERPQKALELIEEYYDAAAVVLRDNRATILRYMTGAESGVWVARVGLLPAGCILYRPLPGLAAAGELKRLYVRPLFRKRGIAKALLRAAEEFARTRNVCDIYLDTNEQFRVAIAFYKRHGYVACDRYNENTQATVFMRKRLQAPVNVRTFEPGDEEDFRLLNEAWIEKYFRLEDRDRSTLCDPHRHILAPGGQIFMAVRDGKRIGCCALMLKENGVCEVVKMAVAESEQGRGIGRKLLEAVIAYVRAGGYTRLYLETNGMLKNAIHLYESVGFRRLAPESVTKSPYARANVYMEMILTYSKGGRMRPGQRKAPPHLPLVLG